MIHYLKLYLATLLAFFAIDMVWLGFIAQPFYQKHLGYLLAPEVNWPAAILFYLLFILGVLVFVVVPGVNDGSLKGSLQRAFLYGLITYATYDLTNQATVKDWPVLVTVVDLAWGMTLSTAVSFISFKAARWMRPPGA